MLASSSAFRGRRKDHLRPEHTHDLAAFDGERLRHARDEGIAFGGTYHGERNAGIARGRFDHRLARLQGTAAFRVLDDGDREPVLHR